MIAREDRPRLPARVRDAGDAQVGLDGLIGDTKPRLLKFTAYSLGAPEGFSPAIRRIRAIVSPGSGGRPGAERDSRRQGARNPVPAQRRLGPEEGQGLAPGADAVGERHQGRPIRPRHGRAYDAAAQYRQLPTQQGVLGERPRRPRATSAPVPVACVIARGRAQRPAPSARHNPARITGSRQRQRPTKPDGVLSDDAHELPRGRATSLAQGLPAQGVAPVPEATAPYAAPDG